MRLLGSSFPFVFLIALIFFQPLNAGLSRQVFTGLSLQEQDLFRAVWGNDIPKIEQLLKEGVDIDAQNRFGRTALHESTLDKLSVDVLRFLIKRGADLEAITVYGFTALHSAALGNNFNAVGVLIEAGVDPKVRDTQGNLALDLAKKWEFKDVVNFLSDLSMQDKKPTSTLPCFP